MPMGTASFYILAPICGSELPRANGVVCVRVHGCVIPDIDIKRHKDSVAIREIAGVSKRLAVDLMIQICGSGAFFACAFVADGTFHLTPEQPQRFYGLLSTEKKTYHEKGAGYQNTDDVCP